MELKLDSIEKKVKAALDDLHKPSNHWSAPKLTRKVKEAVGSLGKDLAFTVYWTGHGGERIYDLCWREEGDDDLVLNTPLAMECELSPDYGAILQDFQKLLVSRAAHRILLIGDLVVTPKSEAAVFKAKVRQLRQFCATNGITITVERTKDSIDIYMDGVIYSEGFNKETFLQTLETLNECVEKAQELMG